MAKEPVKNEIAVEVTDRDSWATVEVRIGEGKGARFIRMSPRLSRRLAVKLLNRAEEAEEVRGAKEAG